MDTSQRTPPTRRRREGGIPQADALRMELAAIGGNEPIGSKLDVCYLCPDGQLGVFQHETHRLEAMIESALGLGARTDTWVRSSPRAHGHNGPFERCWCLHAECATEAAVRALRSWPIAPSIVLTAGEHVTALWSLREPVEPVRALAANRALAIALGATAPTEPVPLLRLAGTFDHSTSGPPPPIVATYFAPESFTAEQVVASARAAA